ncbi:2-oxo acid dehydrogenase subunit E2 [Croceicoccus ponticola]|uniref:Dihydrolipoamide acetyltransferase component of pyruvate dehydrogenase complex n=1 Tax=Croceicoccus ponticola TaxID=2217664 RepID=A0A437GXE9_9SPHN|nr:dihydrolipoamide acetyltransferase family protein [Croceicoccus ponticola]RVQ67075.1 2-oxo acid dehydrogenase subunit E2 [Croceicoccus ponticola]
MGTYKFRLPDIGEGVAEAEVTAWHVKVGDRIEEDDALCDVMTDKATVDMTSPVGGTIRALHGEVGQMKAVGSVLVELEVEGEGNVADEASAAPTTVSNEAPERPTPPPAPSSAPTPTPAPASKPAAQRPAPAPTATEQACFPLAAPATRRRAAKLGIDLSKVPGTGRHGRVTPDDIENYLGGGDPRFAMRGGVDEIKIIGLRRKIAERMEETWRRIPHITYVEDFDVTAIEELREVLNRERKDGQPKLTFLPFLVRAIARTVPDFPHINAHYDDDAGVLRQHGAVHVGIAAATPAGLMVPVVRHAESLDAWQTAEEIARLSTAARDGKASREELSGSTITITSLGPIGGVVTTPIINRPETAIVGPNKIVERLERRNGEIVTRKVMSVSSSFDHRIVDGYEAAKFIQALKRLIENPALLYMD